MSGADGERRGGVRRGRSGSRGLQCRRRNRGGMTPRVRNGQNAEPASARLGAEACSDVPTRGFDRVHVSVTRASPGPTPESAIHTVRTSRAFALDVPPSAHPLVDSRRESPFCGLIACRWRVFQEERSEGHVRILGKSQGPSERGEMTLQSTRRPVDATSRTLSRTRDEVSRRGNARNTSAPGRFTAPSDHRYPNSPGPCAQDRDPWRQERRRKGPNAGRDRVEGSGEVRFAGEPPERKGRGGRHRHQSCKTSSI